MPKITVDLGKQTYTIEIENGLFSSMGAKLAALYPKKKMAIVTDDVVAGLYGEKLAEQLRALGVSVLLIAFPHGERSKNITVLSEVYAKLALGGMTRSDLLITLGGGVPGDLGGFAAATFLRGIDFVQIPTTLLAQIDSSVGGKVAVDLEAGKNLVGNFYQPKGVFIDPELLRTLPERFLHDGLAEAIKYGAIADVALFEQIEHYRDDAELFDNIVDIIFASCSIKARLVEKDEFDRGERMLLNFGHTIGHAIEKGFNYDTFTHGESVGIGMLRLTKQTEKLGLTEKGSAERLKKVLLRYRLPVEATLATDRILDIISLDKKKSGGGITLVILDKIGSARLSRVDFNAVTRYIGEEQL